MKSNWNLRLRAMAVEPLKRFILKITALMFGVLGAQAEVTIEPTIVSLRHVDYAFAVEKNEQGVPVIDWDTFRAQPRKVITQDREGLILENQWFSTTLIPSMGRVYSFIDKATNQEQLYINRLAIPLGAHNDTGFWMTWGGVEHVMPRGEHGTSHALDWKWEIIQQDVDRCAVRMSLTEPLTGLRHQITYAAYPNQESLETEIMVHNPSDQEVAFSHWTTATLAPGGRGEVTPRTEIIVPADSFVPDDRDFNVWMEGMTGATDKSPLRWVGNWKEIGDLMATPLHDPYFAVYSHELDSGLVRTFDRKVTPGFDIWGWGYPPSENRQREFTDQLPTTGYIEVWNGTTKGFSDDALGKISAGESIRWTERMFSLSGINHKSDLRNEISRRSKAALTVASTSNTRPDLIESIDLQVIANGRPELNWFQSRPTVIPGTPNTILVTTQELRPSETHGYYNIFAFTSNDGGSSWTEPEKVPSLQRVRQANDFDRVAGDLWLSWHPQSKRVLATGKTFHFAQGKREDNQREEISYAVYNPADQSWTGLQTVTLPETDSSGRRFVTPNAGCNQPAVLASGDILLPIRYQKHPEKVNYTTAVVRCRFDGQTLNYINHGTELSYPKGRGLYEPSLTQFQDRFYLTLRADHSAYVAASDDGLTFPDGVTEWRFEDGEPLGSYNTQQHWVVHPQEKGLFLAYTRRGANNDHIFRHRAPLFIAQVDPKTLRVIRDTERVLVPENHACLGNFGACQLSNNETLVVTSEYLLPKTKRAGKPNRVLMAKIHWRL